MDNITIDIYLQYFGLDSWKITGKRSNFSIRNLYDSYVQMCFSFLKNTVQKTNIITEI